MGVSRQLGTKLLVAWTGFPILIHGTKVNDRISAYVLRDRPVPGYFVYSVD